jgi:hypothetical protein
MVDRSVRHNSSMPTYRYYLLVNSYVENNEVAQPR